MVRLMKKTIVILLVVMLATPCLAKERKVFRGTVIRVLNGNTIIVDNGTTMYRLDGVEPLEDAYVYLKNTLFGKTVTIALKGWVGHYTIMVDVYTPDGTHVNKDLIDRGFAKKGVTFVEYDACRNKVSKRKPALGNVRANPEAQATGGAP
jgi:endonuclease YncB( thermonuclease family)